MQITLKMLEDVKILAAMYTDFAGGSSLTEFWLNEKILLQFSVTLQMIL